MKRQNRIAALFLVSLSVACLVLVLPAFADTSSINPTQTPLPFEVWSKTYSYEGVIGAVQTADGGYAIISSTGGPTIIKLNSQGTVQWSETYNLPSDNVFPTSIVQTSDGGYAMVCTAQSEGGYVERVWLVKVDSSGEMQWNQLFGDNQGVYEANSLIQTSDGGYAIAGDFAGYTGYTGLGGWNFLFIKTNSNGNPTWTKQYGGPNDDRAESIVQTSDGGYALAGCTSTSENYPEYWLVKTDASGNMQWNQTYSESLEDWAYGLTKTSDGGYALTGTASSSPGGIGSAWLVKTDSTGKMQWNLNIGGSAEQSNCIIQTSDGGYAVTGGPTFQLAKVDADGSLQWLYNGQGNDFSTVAVIQAKDGNYIAVGGGSLWLAEIAGPGSTVQPTTTPTPSPSATPQPINSSSNGPTIQLTGQSQTSSNIRVNLAGSLTAGGSGISGASILLSYSVDNGVTWNELTSVNTDSSGDFAVLWTPLATGNYLVHVVWGGNSDYPPVNATVSLAITPCSQQSFFSINSNSTLSSLSFDAATKQLTFTVSGPTGSTGHLDIFIPKAMLSDVAALTVTLDGNQIQYSYQSAGDSWLIHLAYHHSTHQITMDMNSNVKSSNQLAEGAVVAAGICIIAVAATALATKKLRANRSQ